MIAINYLSSVAKNTFFEYYLLPSSVFCRLISVSVMDELVVAKESSLSFVHDFPFLLSRFLLICERTRLCFSGFPPVLLPVLLPGLLSVFDAAGAALSVASSCFMFGGRTCVWCASFLGSPIPDVIALDKMVA